MASGCGCNDVYRFPHTTYPYSSCICSFCSSIPTFCSFKKIFFFCFQYFSVMKFYVLNNFSAHIRASHGSHMKAAHVLYMKKHTQTYYSYPAMDISCMTSRSMM